MTTVISVSATDAVGLQASATVNATITSSSAPVPDVTGFSPANGASIQVDGKTYLVENANQTWSISNPDTQTLRFELRSGDHWPPDVSDAERTEIEGQVHYPAGESFGYNRTTDLHVTYEFMMEAGTANAAAWMVIGQFHGTVANQPPFYFAMAAEKMHVEVRDPSNVGNVVYADPNNIQRGHWYSIDIMINFANGTLVVLRDGVTIVNFSGAMGTSTDRYYWKHGVYRQAASQTIACNYRNFVISP